ENDSQNAYNYYLNLKGVDSVTYDVVVHADNVSVKEVEEDDNSKDVSSNATSYQSWGLDYMGFRAYSDLVLSGGKNKIAVAVLDTGINTSHSLFSGRILHKYGKNCTDESSPSAYAFEDLNFHGSHTSGVIAQATGSNVQIIPVKVLDYNGDGYASDIVEGLEYVARIKSSVANDGYNLKVVNMSLGLKSTAGASVVSSLTNAVNNVYNSGIIPVVSAGNDRKNTVNVCPANVANAVTVSALKKSSTGVLSFDSSYSNYGSAVDFAAPGTSIISCNANPSYGKYKGNYLSADGTSMAAPHVAAAFALAFSNPYLENSSISAVNKLFEENAIDYGTTGKDIYYGYGLINLENVALRNYEGTINFNVDENNNTVQLDCSYNGSDRCDIYYSLVEDVTSITPDSATKYNGGKIYLTETSKISVSAFIYNGSNLIGQVVDANTNKTIFSKIVYIDNIDISINYNVTTDGDLIDYYGELSKVKIPDAVNGVTVTSISSSAFNGTNVTEVILPRNLTLIGERAFYYNTKIKNIDASN
ncbi:MAG: S8 family serine peptidase, partial [Clostridia bacterium]|nr:S8 family serine peptidase [Clostridia bacterium]